jgi:nitroreductase
MSETFRIKDKDMTWDELMTLDPVVLRALIHERAHHTVEVSLYHILSGKRKAPPNLGEQAKILLDAWEQRNLPMDDSDIKWALDYVELAEKVVANEEVVLDTKLPEPFTEEEMEVVDKLIFQRRSIRQWKDEEVPDWMIERIIEAGQAAPNACNMQCQRFLVLKDEESMNIIKGDVGVAPVKIVICSDMRIYDWMGFPDHTPQNIYMDAAAVADHMMLMAHSIGLGGVWLTHRPIQIERLRKHLSLPNYLRMDTHVAFGWPDEAPIKSARMPLKDTIVEVKE